MQVRQLPSVANMTFPNRMNYRLRSREKSEQAVTLTVCDVSSDTFGTLSHIDSKVKCQDDNINYETLVLHDHALLPLIHNLMAMISQPAKLLAALVSDCDKKTSKQMFWGKATVYQQSELQGMITPWRRIIEDIELYELTPMDVMMLKATVYYWHLWQYVCISCVDAVASIEESATSPQPKQESRTWTSQLQKRSAASISPPLENKCSTELSQKTILSSDCNTNKRSRINRKSNEFLIAWFLTHKDNPYPSSDERMEIAEKTGLAEQQVRNWFANMRKRHWKPNRANTKKPRCLVDYMLRN
ncbi:Transcription factor MEIS1 and related HOX domain proteins [Plasmopara halstedii]|uniref:Transcription factor MEIS1 and related HOX domain proteins n=1 Tax=Plasmopara halstedii TaxID=4781 RepID=A0A0P1AEI5_PLAHL|nr:Transcription factor MEIS1 and related HOX domain proteins [Plasmopara halstedii]CEG39069.1 Transcription factor MEIS1 and related HOX domain proteins [Plasmopara halstedii]|eukprot:XP_024575438.1 Transcription factor MEIS1 and related HOX domain proteins [Plasmopara halstedii]